MNDLTVSESVKNYYGKVLVGKDDLKTSACCPIEAMPQHLLPLLKNLHPQVQDKFYGCGSPIPHALSGQTVVDLGCGTGRDAYLLSQLVGETGKVIGVDMTDEQLSVANAHQQYHQQKFGYAAPNVAFHQAYIEDLSTIGIADQSVDVVISNCVINLSPAKEQVFNEIFRILKPGGELFFSDVFASRRVPEHLQRDPILLGECLGGALYIEDFRRMLNRLSIFDYRIVNKGDIALHDDEVNAKVGMINFYSATVRVFNSAFEDVCENYGHVAFYRGGIEHSPHRFILDDHHIFEKDLPVAVCGNTAKMLSESRYGQYFEVIGDFTTHHGIFDCGPDTGASNELPCC